MKQSRDTETRPISSAAIAQQVALISTLGVNYITVDTHWEYPGYMKKWIDAVRASGKHVWFRAQPNQWHDDNGASGIMTPQAFETAEYGFITANPSFFQSGDIFDAISEPEDGLFWNTYPSGWSWRGAPNQYTDSFNQFLLDTTSIANNAFVALGIKGVITSIRSTNSWWASHPSSLYNSTVAALGRVTMDSYPEGTSTDPSFCASARLTEIESVHAARPGTPIVIGEMGYSNSLNVDDATQDSVLRAEFAALQPLSYLAGLSYWVGPGSPTSGGYTYILSRTPNGWASRPSAADLAAFFASKLAR